MGTLTYSNTDVMPNEFIILSEGFLGSIDTDFDDSSVVSGARMEVGGNFLYILQVGVYICLAHTDLLFIVSP